MAGLDSRMHREPIIKSAETARLERNSSRPQFKQVSRIDVFETNGSTNPDIFASDSANQMIAAGLTPPPPDDDDVPALDDDYWTGEFDPMLEPMLDPSTSSGLASAMPSTSIEIPPTGDFPLYLFPSVADQSEPVTPIGIGLRSERPGMLAQMVLGSSGVGNVGNSPSSLPHQWKYEGFKDHGLPLELPEEPSCIQCQSPPPPSMSSLSAAPVAPNTTPLAHIPIEGSTVINTTSLPQAMAARRAKNTQAARRSRARKADKLGDMKRENEILASRTVVLMYENERLRDMVKQLKTRLGEEPEITID